MKSPPVKHFGESSPSRDPSQSDVSWPDGLSTTEVTQRIVYVVDDDTDLRESLEFLMATRDIFVHPFESGCAFFDAVEGLSAAPIILDIRMPKMNGIEFQEELGKRGITWPVIVLTGHGEVAMAVRAVKLGAIDFLEKPVEALDLEKCLDLAFKNLENEWASSQAKLAAIHLLSRLTPRESEVLTGLCSGQSNKQVGWALSISPRTVEMHRAKALRRLGIKSIAEVVTMMNAAKQR